MTPSPPYCSTLLNILWSRHDAHRQRQNIRSALTSCVVTAVMSCSDAAHTHARPPNKFCAGSARTTRQTMVCELTVHSTHQFNECI